MADFTIKEREYQSAKLDALKQAHLLRRLLPIISSLTGLAKLAPSGAPGQPIDPDIAKEAFAPMAAALSELSDEHFDYIVSLCLSSVKRRDGDRLVPIWHAGGKRPQYDDIDMGVMLMIMGNVIMDNLSGFLPAGPSPLTELLKKTGQA